MRDKIYTLPMSLLISVTLATGIVTALRRKRLITVGFLIFFVSLAAGIVTLGWLLYRSQQESCRTKAEYNLTAIADLKVSELSTWRKERLADAKVFYKNNAFSDSGAALYRAAPRLASARRASDVAQPLPGERAL